MRTASGEQGKVACPGFLAPTLGGHRTGGMKGWGGQGHSPGVRRRRAFLGGLVYPGDPGTNQTHVSRCAGGSLTAHPLHVPQSYFSTVLLKSIC